MSNIVCTLLAKFSLHDYLYDFNFTAIAFVGENKVDSEEIFLSIFVS